MRPYPILQTSQGLRKTEIKCEARGMETGQERRGQVWMDDRQRELQVGCTPLPSISRSMMRLTFA